MLCCIFYQHDNAVHGPMISDLFVNQSDRQIDLPVSRDQRMTGRSISRQSVMTTAGGVHRTMLAGLGRPLS